MVHVIDPGGRNNPLVITSEEGCIAVQELCGGFVQIPKQVIPLVIDELKKHGPEATPSLRCPECGSDESFAISRKDCLVVSGEGIEQPSDAEIYDDYAETVCGACEHMACFRLFVRVAQEPE